MTSDDNGRSSESDRRVAQPVRQAVMTTVRDGVPVGRESGHLTTDRDGRMIVTPASDLSSRCPRTR